MGIDLVRLRYFVAVAEELHFRRAADRLHITPPPLSKQIKLLERELGGALFERDYHEVRLTPLGRALVEPARQILDQVDELTTTAETITRSVAPLRVGATAYAPSDVLDALEKALTQLQSVPTVFTIPGSAAEVTAHLVAGHLDLGLIHLPATDSRVEYRVMTRYQSCIAVRSDDPLAERDIVTIEDLREREVAVDFARPNPAILAGLTRRLEGHGITRIVRASVTGGGSEVEMAVQVRNKHLVMLVGYTPGSILSRIFSPPTFTLIPIDESSWQPGELALAWSRAPNSRRPELDRVIDELIEVFAAPDRGVEPGGQAIPCVPGQQHGCAEDTAPPEHAGALRREEGDMDARRGRPLPSGPAAVDRDDLTGESVTARAEQIDDHLAPVLRGRPPHRSEWPQ